MSRLIILFSSVLILSSCKPSNFNYYYRTLGKMECDYVRIMEERMRILESNEPNFDRYDSLGIEMEIKLYEYSIFIKKHEKYRKEIMNTFPIEQVSKEKSIGYEQCNCDSCLFKENVFPFGKIKSL